MATLSRPFYAFILWATVFGMVVTELPSDMLPGVHKKFEYKYSFKQPMLVNSKGEVPFWDREGDAIPTEIQIRVCPSIQDRRGLLWTKSAFDKSQWMMDIEFSITGKSTYGADGMAFWFTADRGYSGPMFGNTESFIGLAVIIDTFDNNGLGDSPKIGVYIGNGSFHYNLGSDGLNQDSGHCLKFVRNKRYNPKIKVVYYEKQLEVWLHEGDSDQANDYESCVKLEGITLPSKGYFGVSAATGGLSDDHDVTSYIVHSLLPQDEHRQKMIDKKRVDELQDQYSKMSETFDTRKAQYRKDHNPDETDWEKRMELEENIQLVYDMQTSIQRTIRDISIQMNKLSERGGGGGGASDGTVLASEKRLAHHIQELRSQLEKGSLTSGGTNSNIPASEQMQPLYEMKENMKQLLRRMDELQKKVEAGSGSGSGNCPPGNMSCLSTWFFILAMIVQSGIVVMFLIYKQSQERNAKKFF